MQAEEGGLMGEIYSPGRRFRDALSVECPLQIVGVINAYAAIMAERVGFRAIYLSGSGVASASYGLPDLGMTTLNEVLEDVRRITNATELPLLVDVDTGWGNAFMIAKTVRQMIRAGAAAAHIEDQVSAKRCGHRPNKEVVSPDEMVDRIKAAVDAKTDPDFVLMARTDALAIEGLDAAIERVCRYKDAGADMIFAEAVIELEQYRKFADAVGIPILANITEFGKTNLYTTEELRSAGVSLALYPLSAFRAMNAAALGVFQALRDEGSQKRLVDMMQTREESYEILNYHEYERKIDGL
jgi:methylisocitrate lyase